MDLLNSNRETCRQREREAAVRRDILATGSTDDEKDGHARTEPVLSPSLHLCSFVSDVSMYMGIRDRTLFPRRAHMLDTLTKIMIAHKHLWPRCLQSSPGISWGWVRKEKLILLLLSARPLTSFQHSSSYSFLCCSFFFLTADFISIPLLIKCIYKCTFSFFTRTKRRQTRSYSLLPSPLALLILSPSPILSVVSHTITKYQALPSPISCMLGELRRSAGPRNEDTQSVVVGAAVCQSHLHSTVFQPASFKWSSEGELLSRSGVHRDVGGEARSMCAGG